MPAEETDTSMTLGPAGIDTDDEDVEREDGADVQQPMATGNESDDDGDDGEDASDVENESKDDGTDAIEEARAQAALAELSGSGNEQTDEDDEPKAKPQAKPKKPEKAKAEPEDATDLMEGEVDSLVEDFGVDRKQAQKIAERQAKRLETVVARARDAAKSIVDEALAPYKGIFEDSKRRAAQEYTQSVDRSLDDWAKRNKVAGVGESGKLKGPERLLRAVLVREAQKLVNTLPKSARDSVTDDALFAAAYPAAELYLKAKGFRIGAAPKISKPQSQANGSVTRPPGSLPAASAASAQRPGGRTQSQPRIPSESSILAKMRAVRDAKAS